MIKIDFDSQLVIDEGQESVQSFPFNSQQAFALLSKAMLRIGWDTKYVYSFTWLGRPIIQLPDDMIRLQEVIYSVKPDVIIEIGIAHGGSLLYSASLCKLMGKGRVIGVDIEIRPHNRSAIESHELSEYITMLEGDSVSDETNSTLHKLISPAESVMIFLDGCHTKEHVAKELEVYAPMVTPGSYIVAMDGIMKDLNNAPRSNPDWTWNNPSAAAREFVTHNKDFVIQQPEPIFNEGSVSEHSLTYWPDAFIKRIR